MIYKTLNGLLGLFLLPAVAPAAEHIALDVPVWTVLPFAGLLLAIALFPVLAGRFWHNNRNKALVVLLFALPVAGFLVLLELTTGQPGIDALAHEVQEYCSFIILLGSLYVVSGGILIQGNVKATALSNTLILGSGAVLANLIGTTGASMVLIRPVLRINRGRQHNQHLPIFFIFTVSNLGGLLTPLGDPPLFLGFLRGVDFFWTLQLWPQWLVANGLVLAVFFFWDTRSLAREPSSPDRPAQPASFRLCGLWNILFLAGILLAVLFQSHAVSDPVTNLCNRLVPCPNLHLAWPMGEGLMVLMGLLSLALTPRDLRRANAFSWGPMIEVAVLFAGIFVTMVPALDLLERHGGELGLTSPWQFFWLTGGLSAFLDNAPTYVTFATIAARGEPLGNLMTQAPLLLQAISCGAVFMGAMTYVGNGPNFMVKTIAEESGFQVPSFFGYLLYSCLILAPIFLLVTVLFFAG